MIYICRIIFEILLLITSQYKIIPKNLTYSKTFMFELTALRKLKISELQDIAKLSNHYISETDCLWPKGEIKPDTHHIFGHPRGEFHEQFANNMIKKLEEMYND